MDPRAVQAAASSSRSRQKPPTSDPPNSTSTITPGASNPRPPISSTQPTVGRHQMPAEPPANHRSNPNPATSSPNVGGSGPQDEYKPPTQTMTRSDTKRVAKSSSSSLKRAATASEDVISGQKPSKDDLKAKPAKSEAVALASKTAEVCLNDYIAR